MRVTYALLDKVGCAVIVDFQRDRCHLMLKDDHTRADIIYGHRKKVCLEQSISFGSHCME